MSEYQTDTERALEDEREELLALLREQEEIAIRIAKKQRRVAALAALIDDSEEADKIMELDLCGLTNAIRTALKSAIPLGLTPDEIKSRLVQLYFPVNEYTNFRASLIVVLKRLLEAKEIKQLEVATVESGTRRDESVYQWVQRYGASKGRFQSRYKSRFEKK